MIPAPSQRQSATSLEALEARIAKFEAANAELEQALAKELERVAKLTVERDQLRTSYDRLRFELELLKKRIYVAQAERINTEQLELEFASKLAILNELDKQLAAQLAADDAAGGDNGGRTGKKRVKPSGRRDLRETRLPQQRIELFDPILESLVGQGKAERIGYEESTKLARQRGGSVCLVVARSKYRIVGETAETSDIVTTPLPPEPFRRSMAAPSMLAHIIVVRRCLATQPDREPRRPRGCEGGSRHHVSVARRCGGDARCNRCHGRT